jgi:ABC-2 type transport system permease protein
MNNLIPLMRREWLQHRFGWTLLMLVPLLLALLPLAFGSVQFDNDGDMVGKTPPELALMVSSISIMGAAAVVFLLVWMVSLFITSALPRRDHADRSVEFWLSLPSGHAESFAAPLIVHLVLVPAAALLVGLLGGCVVSMVLVTRFVGFGEWLSLPWGELLAGTLSVTLRVIAGLPLAALWLGPLILLAMLANAFFRRWGLPVLAVGLGLGSVLMQAVFGQPLLGEVLLGLMRNAGLSLAGAGGQQLVINERVGADMTIAQMPVWAGRDFVAALQLLASPLFLGALVVSAGLFMLLVLWRQRGAGAGSA